jgi:hypothetical protein
MRYLPLYTYIFRVASSPKNFRVKFSIDFTSFSCVLRVPPTVSSLIRMRIRNYKKSELCGDVWLNDSATLYSPDLAQSDYRLFGPPKKKRSCMSSVQTGFLGHGNNIGLSTHSSFKMESINWCTGGINVSGYGAIVWTTVLNE